jgi:hypothetical protein
MLISLFFAVLNLFVAMNSTNPNQWCNWMASGFCFGLFFAQVIIRTSK